MYEVNCMSCRNPFMWFSGNTLDQRCSECRKKEGPLYQTEFHADGSSTTTEVGHAETPKTVEEIEQQIVDGLPAQYRISALGPVLKGLIHEMALTIHQESEKLYLTFTEHLEKEKP